MTDEIIEELGPSDLGTLEFWEKVYTEELDNFKDHGDVGEIWFGNKASLNVVKWISTKLNLDMETDQIIDIGCGNGMILLELTKKGFKQLTGIDYSQKAINLANEILKENNITCVKLQVCDILDTSNHELLTNYFKVAHDKGTYDAISLHPDEPADKRRKYIDNVYNILQPNGFLILTSCNWTKDELLIHFKNKFDFIDELPVDSFRFGGKQGNVVTQLVFRKKNE
ncbi:PREDICTED: protein-lysine N-methyltransferase mettl10 [Polistes dominula]|uniref:Protein-lysine N-methyltransferase LOC107063742 n=1 Tax=Polistes dominula TaxID=743375 RepID=A0ABM1HTK8_POLDO|nr:PREDICTED: protein-lysine N-methyltransferase mettl10 [Polistes dominula]XP_015171295.1 PREDICTED: protein-lysine N-methyltransferase mettl10 [Polistes dominula]